MSFLRRMLNKYEDLLKFGLVGVGNTMVDFAVYTILYYVGVPYRVAQCFSYAAGTLNSYILNKKWTFAAKKPAASADSTADAPRTDTHKANAAEALRFLVVNLFTLGLSILLLGLLKEQLGLHAIVAKLLVTLVTTLVNFVGSKLWVFRRSDLDRSTKRA
ncbi:GtrA family protein [Gorillibacterium sp. CAU 1737]|uniref:GtrA family protein n=1 Tax=Gorillibacterium sp. CAU 1737 TaxID=3140362 RepID=UPI00326117C7